MYLVLSPLTPNTPSFYRCSLLFYLVEQALKWRGARWSDRHGVFFRFFPENPESRGARRSLVGLAALLSALALSCISYLSGSLAEVLGRLSVSRA